MGLRQVAIALPLNVQYAKEMTNTILSLISNGYIDQIYTRYVETIY